jgi:hypothetical protein
MDKYDPLTQFLQKQRSNEVQLTFDDLEHVVGVVLPPAARTHRQWWENQVSSEGRQCHAWLDAGWAVRDVKLGEGYVVFGRSTVALERGPAPAAGAPVEEGDADTGPSMEFQTVALRCPHCLRRVTVEYRPEGTAFAVRNTFFCPHCRAENRVALPGALTATWLGHGPKPTPPDATGQSS